MPLREEPVTHRADHLSYESTLDLSDVPRLVGTLKADQSVRPVRRFRGGATQAEATLNHYLDARFRNYATVREGRKPAQPRT